MENLNFNCETIFKTNRPFLLKKTLITLFVLAFIFYLIVTDGIIEIIMVSLSFIIYFFRIGKSLKAKGKFPKNVLTWYRDLYKKNKWDILPVSFWCDDSEIKITLSNAELIKGKPVTEEFTIKKENINVVNYYAVDNSFSFDFAHSDITLNNNKSVTQNNSCVIIFPGENTSQEILARLKENNYNVVQVSNESECQDKNGNENEAINEG